jgi:hypothetical protein
MALLPKTKQAHYMFQQFYQHIFTKEYYGCALVTHACNLCLRRRRSGALWFKASPKPIFQQTLS